MLQSYLRRSSNVIPQKHTRIHRTSYSLYPMSKPKPIIKMFTNENEIKSLSAKESERKREENQRKRELNVEREGKKNTVTEQTSTNYDGYMENMTFEMRKI